MAERFPFRHRTRMRELAGQLACDRSYVTSRLTAEQRRTLAPLLEALLETTPEEQPCAAVRCCAADARRQAHAVAAISTAPPASSAHSESHPRTSNHSPALRHAQMDDFAPRARLG